MGSSNSESLPSKLSTPLFPDVTLMLPAKLAQ